jgi:hypothetical protein
MGDFLQKEGAAKSSLFKDVRGEREKWFWLESGIVKLISYND